MVVTQKHVAARADVVVHSRCPSSRRMSLLHVAFSCRHPIQRRGRSRVSAQACRSVLMDIRLARTFEQGAMADSVNFPLYQPIAGWGLASNIRRAGFAFFGIYGTERNKEWLAQVEAVVAKSAPLLSSETLIEALSAVHALHFVALRA